MTPMDIHDAILEIAAEAERRGFENGLKEALYISARIEQQIPFKDEVDRWRKHAVGTVQAALRKKLSLPFTDPSEIWLHERMDTRGRF